MKRIMVLVALCSAMGLVNANSMSKPNLPFWPKLGNNGADSNELSVVKYDEIEDSYSDEKDEAGYSSSNNTANKVAHTVNVFNNFPGNQGGENSSRTNGSVTKTLIKYGAVSLVGIVIGRYALDRAFDVVTKPETYTQLFAQGFFKQVGNWSGNWMSYCSSASIFAMMAYLRNQGVNVMQKAVATGIAPAG